MQGLFAASGDVSARCAFGALSAERQPRCGDGSPPVVDSRAPACRNGLGDGSGRPCRDRRSTPVPARCRARSRLRQSMSRRALSDGFEVVRGSRVSAITAAFANDCGRSRRFTACRLHKLDAQYAPVSVRGDPNTSRWGERQAEVEFDEVRGLRRTPCALRPTAGGGGQAALQAGGVIELQRNRHLGHAIPPSKRGCWQPRFVRTAGAKRAATPPRGECSRGVCQLRIGKEMG